MSFNIVYKLYTTLYFPFCSLEKLLTKNRYIITKIAYNAEFFSIVACKFKRRFKSFKKYLAFDRKFSSTHAGLNGYHVNTFMWTVLKTLKPLIVVTYLQRSSQDHQAEI